MFWKKTVSVEEHQRVCDQRDYWRDRVNALLDEIEVLKPDALKYRERLRRDRENAASKRKLHAA